MSDKTKVLEAIQELRNRVRGVRKEKKPGLNYEIVSYDTVLDAIQEYTLELGLNLIPHKTTQTNCTPYSKPWGQKSDVRFNCDTYTIDFRLYHTSGEYLDISLPAIGIDQEDHGPSKAVTMATRTAWMTVLMLKRGKDFGEQPQQTSQQSRSEPPPQQEQKTTYTNDPSTWPPKWAQLYHETLDKVKDKDALEQEMEVPWVQKSHALDKFLRDNGCPDAVRKPFMANTVVWLLKTLMETRHSQNAGNDARTYFKQLCEWVGPQIADQIKARMPGTF